MLLLFFMLSCDHFLEVDFPENQLSGDIVFQDDATALAALTAIYANLRDKVLLTGNSNGLHVIMGLYSDELDYYGSSGQPLEEFYNHTLLPSSVSISQLWNDSYHTIYMVNSLLEGINDNSHLSYETIQKIKGEALFVRALTHFYLVNLFGAVPYVIQTDYTLNSNINRLEVNEVYKAIVSDLKAARSFLSSGESTEQRIVPDKWAATTLLAKVYLYMGDWERAELESTSIIENTGFSWETDLSNVFLKESGATIWQLKPPVDGYNTLEASTFNFVSAPPPLIALNEQLLEVFEDGDARKATWIAGVSNGIDVWYHANKYKNVSTTSNTEYSIVFRLAEIYLIRAEARTNLGNISEALSDVNKIRQRANLTDLNIIDPEELLEAILLEKRVELFTEFGNRWFDLKRLGKAEAVISSIKSGWESKNLLLPIPENELSLNPNLSPQNPGY
ncbi:RagB/SusD family nutrient uptake outer membrane protein [Aureibaculum sp. 2210JD6-5]|uniref:RagB/SusD family nutrient uptake outer membrane protein n=1 Tax=Aureibaculum sp. 2210JD6-5 TaxID=3103957 RepID=UPI002ABDAF50|nr:RagB/SusD family nutrient uptake outer membrane protein [Aureibaculum sp. 2210JD6-5]